MESATRPPPDVFRLRTAPAVSQAAFPLGLGEQGVHEICEAGFGDMAALTGFALATAGQRPGAALWVSQRCLKLDHGGLLNAGLSALRRRAMPVVEVRTGKLREALWAVEEAIRCSAVSLVIAEIEGIDFTSSRRLTLASNRHGVPAILLLPYTCEGSTAASARWRVSPRPSSPNRFDPRALGHPRWRAVLERSRAAPQMAGKVFDLETNDETLSLSVVPGLAADAAPALAESRERSRLRA